VWYLSTVAAPRPFRPLLGLLVLLLTVAVLAGLVAGAALADAGMDAVLEQRTASLQAEGWAFRKDVDGVRVLERNTPGSPLREVLALALTPTPPARLMAVVGDYNAYPDFMPYVVQSEVLPATDGITRVFQHLDFGLPIRDRAYTLRMIPFYSPHDGSRGVAWTLEKDPAYQRDARAVRPVINDGSWTFTPLGGQGPTLVAYLVRSDPGGWIPRWAADLATRHAVPKVVGVVLERAAAGP
jgi:hypothetical protein